MTVNYKDKGPDVVEIQEALLAHGYELPEYGADGDLGDETVAALTAYSQDTGVALGFPIPQKFLDHLLWDAPEDPDVPPPPSPSIGAEIFDFQDEPWELRNPKKFKRVGGKPVVREPSQVTGITIHQTAVKYCVAPYQVKAAGGDERLALARRSLQVACHVMAFHDGFLAWPNPLEWYVYHGNGFNAFELGIEIDGNYPGVRGGPTWNGKKATDITPNLITAARAGIELLVREGRKLGMPIEYIHAHRQSSATRRDDPGEELWKNVVLDFAVPVLGLRTELRRTLRDGRPVPREWDPNGHGNY